MEVTGRDKRNWRNQTNQGRGAIWGVQRASTLIFTRYFIIYYQALSYYLTMKYLRNICLVYQTARAENKHTQKWRSVWIVSDKWSTKTSCNTCGHLIDKLETQGNNIILVNSVVLFKIPKLCFCWCLRINSHNLIRLTNTIILCLFCCRQIDLAQDLSMLASNFSAFSVLIVWKCSTL